MRILGIDPGSKIMGIALMDGSRIELDSLTFGKSMSMLEKLKKIYDTISGIIKEKSPDAMAVENAFFAKNPHVAFVLGQVRSSAIIAALNLNIKIYEYTPTEVKKGITGYGMATKEQVRTILEKMLNINLEGMPLDVSDALAVAFCHSSMANIAHSSYPNRDGILVSEIQKEAE